jgi:hypothetical protein
VLRRGGRATLVRLRAGGRSTTLLGTAAPLRNDRLDEHGNAALALGVLGGRARLVWYLPALGDALATEEKSFLALLPDGWRWGVLQAGVAVLLLAAWRARRLGPVVREPLPVVVPAAETVEGRARLYRRARARDQAAAALREAALARLAARLGLPPTAGAGAVAAAVSARASGPAGAVDATLCGPPPPDDAALVRLADDLDALEGEVRRT